MPNRHISPYGIIPNLNAIRILIVAFIAVGYASTMPLGPSEPEVLRQFGYDPSWIGIQLLFFYSGLLALRSLRRHGSSYRYLMSRVMRNAPLLIVFTLITVLAIYPVFGKFEGDIWHQSHKLFHYFATTVTCIAPGQALPGLLDEAKYMCLIQGGIWTLRWGLIAHLLVSGANLFGLFNKNRYILIYVVISALSFLGLQQYIAETQNFAFEPLLMPLRLGTMFLIGMAAYGYQDRLPQTTLARALTLVALWGVTFLTAAPFMPWTSWIELSLVLSWAWGSFMLVTASDGFSLKLKNWPNIVLALYLAIWPVAQLLLIKLPNIGSWGLIMLSLPISLIIAYVFFWLFARKIYEKAERFSGMIEGPAGDAPTPGAKPSRFPFRPISTKREVL